jgi:hypothetical protein
MAEVEVEAAVEKWRRRGENRSTSSGGGTRSEGGTKKAAPASRKRSFGAAAHAKETQLWAIAGCYEKPPTGKKTITSYLIHHRESC